MKHHLLTTIAAVVLVGCGEPSIQHAARYGNIEAIKQHIAAGTDVNAHGGKYDGTPLHEAAAQGHKEVAELLIAKGADVNVKDDDGSTPLHKAAGLGRKEIVELLIAEDADLNAKTYSGQTPLDRAVLWAEDKPEIAVFLRKHGGQTGEELNKEGK